MRTATRRSARRPLITSAVGLAVLALAACGSGSSPGEGTGGAGLRLALNQTEQHPSYVALDAFGQRLSEETSGRWSVDVFANETLGAQAEALQLVSDGSVDMAIVSGTQLENLDEDFTVFSLPTVFESVEHQMSVVNDPEITGDLYSSLEDANRITVVGGFTQGARSVYTKDAPVETPDDLAGQKVRVQESELFLALMEALGASPTPMAYGEVYTALQSGVIDGAENNEVSYVTQKHHEVAPYFSSTRHVIGIDYLIVNTDVLTRMTQDDRAAFDDAWTEAHQQHTELWTEATEQAVTDGEAAGATFTEVDSAAFATALAPVVEQFLTTDDQRALFDAARSAAD